MIETLHGGPESYSRSELCRALGVSRSGLYDHGAKAQRPRRLQDKELAKEIELLFSQSRRTYALGGPSRCYVARQSAVDEIACCV